MLFTYTDKIKPYVRMTQKGKWMDPQAREYLASKTALSTSLKAQLAGRVPIPPKTPFAVSLTYQAPNVFQFDLDNLLKAVMDAANGILFNDDRWCTEVRRLSKQRGPFALVFEVVPVEEETKPMIPAFVIPPFLSYAQRSE